MLNDVIATIENCRYCLMCRHVSPLRQVSDKETLSPHGIALIIASQRRGLIDWTEETVNIVYSEPDSGNSRAHCIFDQPYAEAIAAVRAELVAQEIAPQAIYQLHEQLKVDHSPYGAKPAAATRQQSELALFVGDEAFYLWPTAIEALLKLFNAIDIEPVLIGQGKNNAYLASSLGFPDTAKQQAQSILNELDATQAQSLLVLSAADYFCFHQLYPERLGLSLPESVSLLDSSQLLASALQEGSLKLKRSNDSRRYAYVDPSHAVRVPQHLDAPRVLLQAVLGDKALELFWHKERAQPAGNTSLKFSQPHLAKALTRARLQDAKTRGAEIVICEDPGTLAVLAGQAGDFDLEVKGLYEVLADYLQT